MSNSTFLPEDYLAQKAARRTNIISLTLFAIVMVAVFGAFLLMNRQWRQVKNERESLNVQYQQAAMQIDRLTELEKQRTQMVEKAELAAALVERVPRSILLAELVKRMPPRLSLLQFELKCTEIKAPKPAADPKAVGTLNKPSRPKTREEASLDATKIEPPRYRVDISIIGVAPTDQEVSQFMRELNAFELLADVRLLYSEEQEIESRMMRQFKIEMVIGPDADVRTLEQVDPNDMPDPMSDELRFERPGDNNTALAE